ncbi:MAG: DegT/DnrJ/EryC1/StrS family aminotransferase [Candidatus Firestonebacteria bacterium]
MIKAKLVDTDIKLYELFFAFLASMRGKGKGVLVFEDFLRGKAKAAEAVVFGSGNAALLASLTAMKVLTKGEKTEVIIPAYTPLAVYIVIKQAGLKPVLCDIEVRDFGLSPEGMKEKANSKTLAAVPVRLFGLESSPRGKNNGFFVIEDNAQGFITPLKWDLQLLSFNRGKNFPLLNGGAVLTNDEGLAEEIRKVRASYLAPSRLNNITALIKFTVFCLLKNRLCYNMMLPFIERVKQTKPPEHISKVLLSSWQGMLGAGRIFYCDKNMKRRFELAKKISPVLERY